MAKKREDTGYSVILDTSFMIRLLNESDVLHSNAKGYFRYFLDNDVPMYFSTVSIAEYCVKGDFYDLPFQNIRVLPFNIFHAKEAGLFAKTLFNARSKGIIEMPDRLIIPNDPKFSLRVPLKRISGILSPPTLNQAEILISSDKSVLQPLSIWILTSRSLTVSV